MKTKRFVSTLLALLLVCSLPVSAFADTVADNPAGTTVTEISTGDTMDTNSGTVTTNNGTGTVGTNSGIVTTNNGTVTTNFGTVTTNNGTVEDNANTVEANNNYILGNLGTLKTNNGTVEYNPGTVETNNGTVNNNDGSVIINNTTGIVNEGYAGTNYGTVKLGDTTWYGVLVDNDGTKTLEQNCTPGQVLDFSKLTKEGYVYAGYTQAYGMENGKVTLLPSPITVNETSYTVTCPNVLTLIWRAIASPAAASDDGAGSFGPGSVISINGHKFLLVAVVEDVYCLASVESFEDEALSALPALLASLLTEEQLTHVTGDPELLDEELTARFFAGQGSHIVFPCDSGLIFS